MFFYLFLNLGRGLAYDELLRHYFVIDARVTAYVAQQQFTGCGSHKLRLVFNGRHTGRDVLGVHVVGEAYECHVVRDAESQLLDGCKGGKGDDVVESQNGAGRSRGDAY